MAGLIYKDEGGVERRHRLERDQTFIGRAPTNQLVLTHPLVSRLHCLIERRGDRWIVVDQGSRYGTFVNERRLETESALAPGDILRIGDVRVTFAAEAVGAGEADSPLDQLARFADALAAATTALPEAEQRKLPSVATLRAALDEVRAEVKRAARLHWFARGLPEAGRMLRRMTDPDAVLASALDLAMRTADARRGYIATRRLDGVLQVRHWRGYADDARQAAELELERSVPARVTHSGTPLLEPTCLCVPLTSSGARRSGALYLEGEFAARELGWWQQLARDAADALEQARSGERTELTESINVGELAVIGGDARVVTVLFADIRSFTPLLERLLPAEAVEMLNEYLTEMVDVVLAEKGTLDKFTGDGLMAFWGAPIDQNDQAVRAVRAGLAMQARVPALFERWRREGRTFSTKMTELLVGIGIHTGVVVVGNIGSTKRMEYTAIGDAVNTASRVQGTARGGEVVITATTREHLGDALPLEALPPVTVKGKALPIEVYRVLPLARAGEGGTP